ncbi:hypothetical protein E9993_03220 [Labilibacter sediminis]|nr:hypothetical protein E9993_03220 [Labilibacter sediminis]
MLNGFFKSRLKTIGLIILVLCYGYISYKLIQFKDWQAFKSLITKSPLYFIQILGLQLCLALLNILIESKKWQVLLNSITKVKPGTSFKMVLAGFSTGIFTPAKIGEPFGRLMKVPRHLWGKGAVLNYFGGIIHNAVIFLTGICCTVILWIETEYHPYQKVLLYVISVAVFIALVSISVWHFRIHIKAILKHFNIHDRINHFLSVLKLISIPKGLWIFTLSALRFCIYSLQLFLFFVAFGSVNTESSFLLMIPVYYMAITLIPSFLLADIGIRSSVALLLFASTSISEPVILLSVFMTWLVNQVFPAVGGSLLLYKRTISAE